MILLLLAVLSLAPSARAEESFEQNAESVIRSDWRKGLLDELERERALRPLEAPLLSTSPAPTEDRVTLRYSLEEPGGRWRDVATMSMTLRTFERYREIERRWEDDAVLRRSNEDDPRRYFGSFGGRDALAAADVIVTGLSKDSFVQEHAWLDAPVTFLVETMRLFERFDHRSAWDVLGFEVNDFVADRFGLGPDRYRPGGIGGPVVGSPDGDFHGRLRVGVSGLERAATKFEADPIRFKVKYEIKCPRSFILDRIEVGGEARPFCRDERDAFRVFVGGGKSF